jgi:hypothetical protein
LSFDFFASTDFVHARGFVVGKSPPPTRGQHVDVHADVVEQLAAEQRGLLENGERTTDDDDDD